MEGERVEDRIAWKGESVCGMEGERVEERIA